MRAFGLIGKKLGHSFSKNYFAKKFEHEKIDDAQYDLYEIPSADELPNLIKKFDGRLIGLNVTIPYKEDVLPFLADIDPAAKKIGAVQQNVSEEKRQIPQLIGLSSKDSAEVVVDFYSRVSN